METGPGREGGSIRGGFGGADLLSWLSESLDGRSTIRSAFGPVGGTVESPGGTATLGAVGITGVVAIELGAAGVTGAVIIVAATAEAVGVEGGAGAEDVD